jgi:hypothetical protein
MLQSPRGNLQAISKIPLNLSKNFMLNSQRSQPLPFEGAVCGGRAGSKTKTNFWVQCSNTPSYSILMFDLRLVRQNVRKTNRT